MYPPPRKLAWDILQRVDREKSYADLLLDIVLKKSAFKEQDRAFITELVYGTLRWRGRIDHVISLYSSKPISKLDPEILNIIRMGAYQLLYLRTPSSAAVDESVKLSKNFTSGKASGFVNAVLRAIDRERDKIRYPSRDDDLLTYLCVEHSHPRWMASMFLKMLGEKDTEELLKANNIIPPLTLRINTLGTTREELRKTLLEEDGIESENSPCSPDGLILRNSPPVRQLGLINRGLGIVQDEAAQLVSRLGAPKPGWTVLDTCAAPGGKTTHMAALMKNEGVIQAVDVSQPRLAMIEDNARRLGITIIKTAQGDASGPLKFARNSFDLVMVDPPCSDLGIIRRHPDVKWIKTPDHIAELAELQLKILSTASKYVKSGGVLVYSVCTISSRESEGVIEKFLEKSKLWSLEPASKILPKAAASCSDGDFLRTYPHKHETDGFFAARIRRNT